MNEREKFLETVEFLIHEAMFSASWVPDVATRDVLAWFLAAPRRGDLDMEIDFSFQAGGVVVAWLGNDVHGEEAVLPQHLADRARGLLVKGWQRRGESLPA
jgi:hypothetical protein